MKSIHALLDGYRAFYNSHFGNGTSTYSSLAEGQSPEVLVIGCSDSRVDPGLIFNAHPGEVFTIRNVANLVPPCEPEADSRHGTSAALEFGVCHLKVRHIVVLGHSECAGIRALMDGVPADSDVEYSFISDWMTIADSAKARANAVTGISADARLHRCEQEAVLLSLQNLMSFPWIVSRVQQKTLFLHGWHFSIHDGALAMYDKESESFERVMV